MKMTNSYRVELIFNPESKVTFKNVQKNEQNLPMHIQNSIIRRELNLGTFSYNSLQGPTKRNSVEFYIVDPDEELEKDEKYREMQTKMDVTEYLANESLTVVWKRTVSFYH